jgi:hypothetical protein
MSATDLTQGFYRKITLNDIQLAVVYYNILINLAKQKHCLTYGELVEKARLLYPNNPAVKTAIPVSIGRKLEIVRVFTSERNLPDLTSLVINKLQGECGDGFTDHFDPIEARKQVFSFDWSSVSDDFDCYINVATPRKKRKSPEAIKIMAEFYKKNKSSYPEKITRQRDFIIESLMDGLDPQDVFLEASKRAT